MLPKFFVYPNPTAVGKVKLDLTLTKKTDIRVRLYNLNASYSLKKLAKMLLEHIRLKYLLKDFLLAFTCYRYTTIIKYLPAG